MIKCFVVARGVIVVSSGANDCVQAGQGGLGVHYIVLIRTCGNPGTKSPSKISSNLGILCFTPALRQLSCSDAAGTARA